MIRLRAWAAAGVLFIPLLLILALSFPYNFDLSDEGLYLYNLHFGLHQLNYNHYFLGFDSLFGSLSLHQIRWATLALLVAATSLFWRELPAAYLKTYGRELPKGSALLLFLSLAFLYTGIPTFSYNTVATLSGLLLLCYCARLTAGRSGLLSSVYLVAGLYLGFSARSSLVVLEIVLVVLYFQFGYRPKSKKEWLWPVAAILIAVVSTALMVEPYPFYLSNIPKLMGLISRSSHTGLIPHYSAELAEFSVKYILLPGIVWAVWRWLRPERVMVEFHVTYLFYGFFQHIVLDFTYFRFFKLLLGQLLLLLVVEAWRTKKVPGLVLASMMICVFVSFGSNNGLLLPASTQAVFLALPMIAALGGFSRGYLVAVPVLWLTALICVHHYQYANFYRAPKRSATEYVRSGLQGIGGQMVPKDLEIFLSGLERLLREGGFDRTTDALVIYSDMPGVAAALRARSFGHAFLSSGYENIDEVNCLYIRKDPGSYKRAFLVRTRPLSARLQGCLSERLHGGGAVVGTVPFHEPRSGQDLSVEVLGPYDLTDGPRFQ
jgi:hypothetical protein